MNEKRGMLEIMAEVLRILNDRPLTKTNIGNRTNLDTRGTNRYLNYLTELNLVTLYPDDGLNAHQLNPVRFMITKKGENFLVEFDKLMEFARIDQEST